MISSPPESVWIRHHLWQLAVLGTAEEHKPRVLEWRALRRVLLEDHARGLDDVPGPFAADPMARRRPRVCDLHASIVSDTIDDAAAALSRPQPPSAALSRPAPTVLPLLDRESAVAPTFPRERLRTQRSPAEPDCRSSVKPAGRRPAVRARLTGPRRPGRSACRTSATRAHAIPGDVRTSAHRWTSPQRGAGLVRRRGCQGPAKPGQCSIATPRRSHDGLVRVLEDGVSATFDLSATPHRREQLRVWVPSEGTFRFGIPNSERRVSREQVSARWVCLNP